MEIKFWNNVLKAAHRTNLKYQQPQKQTDYFSWNTLEISANSETNELLHNLANKCLAEEKKNTFQNVDAKTDSIVICFKTYQSSVTSEHKQKPQTLSFSTTL